MKLQDIIFLVIFVMLLLKRDSMWATLAGIICLFLSVPLFAFWIFFTVQHLICWKKNVLKTTGKIILTKVFN